MKPLHRTLFAFLTLACVGFGGFYLGQQSMNNELDAQFSAGSAAGYESGLSSGYNDGFYAGYISGLSENKSGTTSQLNTVYISEGNKEYHRDPDCTRILSMHTPAPIDEATAITHGYSLCLTCRMNTQKTATSSDGLQLNERQLEIARKYQSIATP